MNTFKYCLSLLLMLALLTGAQAQYFGRNKANYETFDFKVQQTPHFEIYHYLNNDDYLRDFSTWSEVWYRLHQRVLRDTIVNKNPLILYSDHADFQQTNAIFGQVGVGTGGVTEAFKNRVILPIAMSNQQTHHVLGHELVHAFQYNMVINGDSTNLGNIQNLPLWMVEGLAEYMSIGSVDALTAMWMRDAVLNDDVPSLKDLSNPGKYFPYRYGQAFWAFLTGLYGDDIIEPFYTATAKYGFEPACKQVLGLEEKKLSELWVKTVKEHFSKFIGDKKERFVGNKLISEENGGRMNISPVISPNGRYVIFLSEKSLFGIDLFLADANNGKIIRKVASTAKDGHLDDFDYIESAGTWSPDGKRFAFTAFSKGHNVLIIKEADSGNTIEEVEIPGVQAFTNPAWSPKGDIIAMTGLVEGQTDIYLFNIRTKKVERLTNDRYSEMHAHWSDDGSKLLFSTDQLSFERGRTNGGWTFNIAEMDFASRRTDIIDIFFGADNLNPIYDNAGNILFLSNHDGFRNIYKYEKASGKIYQMTDMITGVSGITHYAPAMSIDRKNNRVVYMHFSKNTYSIYKAKAEDFLNKEVENKVDFAAATMPRVDPNAKRFVDTQLANLDKLEGNGEALLTEYQEKNYQPKFQLDYIGGSAGVGVGTSNSFGTSSGIAGGVDALFSDILGNNQLFSSLSLNGEITDFGGSVAYINRKHRIMWGSTLSHTPIRSFGFGNSGIQDIEFSNGTALGIADTFFVQRIFEQSVGAFAAYPFSTTLRLEAETAFSRYSSRVDQYVNIYQAIPVGGNSYGRGNYLGQDREKVASEPGFNLFNVGGALVGDNSYFGLTAPLTGHRFRFGAEQYFGEYNFTAATADYRIYRFFKPIGLAFRAMHYGRYGADSDRLFPIYVGNPWYVRGFNSNAIEGALIQNGQSFDQLVGSRIAVSNFEIRIPFTGPERLALIKSKFLFSDLNFFVDAGVAWYDNKQFSGAVYELDTEGNRKPQIDRNTGAPLVDANGNTLYETLYSKALPLVSTGVSLRVNLFGALILEPYYAFPLLQNSKGTFGLNILPGW